MERETDFDKALQMLTQTVEELAEEARGDGRALLALLRTLERLHQEIRDDLFQKTLPKNRQELYHLLREIESEGGWPYIPRNSLRSLLKRFPLEETAPSEPKKT
ncbi:hypothetical protein LKE08_10750 [Lyngbya sp. CCY1209]|nr:hypothetical protein [Lyngbya sp. CCY1209]